MAYRILDKLGEYLELIRTKTDKEPFEKSRSNINLRQHSLTHTSEIEGNPFTLNLDVKTFNAVIEFENGLDLDKIAKVRLFSLADELIEKLEEDHSSKYNRIGVRSIIISERKEFRFSKLKNYIWDINKIFGDALSTHFNEKYDIGLTFQSKSDNEENIRLSLGPYQQSEIRKYFDMDNEVKEGMIYDIDIWQKDISVPKLKLAKHIKNYQNIYKELIDKIELQLTEAIK